MKIKLITADKAKKLSNLQQLSNMAIEFRENSRMGVYLYTIFNNPDFNNAIQFVYHDTANIEVIPIINYKQGFIKKQLIKFIKKAKYIVKKHKLLPENTNLDTFIVCVLSNEEQKKISNSIANAIYLLKDENILTTL